MRFDGQPIRDHRHRATEIPRLEVEEEAPPPSLEGITEQDRANWIEVIESTKTNVWSSAHLRAQLGLVFPDYRESIASDEGLKEEIVHNAQHLRPRNLASFIQIAADIRILYPGEQLLPGLQSNEEQAVMKMLEDSTKDRLPSNVINAVIALPKMHDQIRTNGFVHDVLWRMAEDSRNDEDWYTFTQTATALILLYPGRKGDLTLDAETTASQLLNMKQAQAGAWWKFPEIAMDLTLLSADEIRISEEDGLELIMHKAPDEQLDNLPERQPV